MKNKAPVQKALRVCKELNVLNWLFQPVKLSVSRTEKPHQEIFKGLNLSNTDIVISSLIRSTKMRDKVQSMH